MLVFLPPSETKAAGGDGAPLDLGSLAFPELRPRREALLDAIGALAKDLPASRTVLGVSAAKDDEIIGNRTLRTSPTRPAVERYTGVLYDALDITGLSGADRAKADRNFLIASALFGAVAAADLIPAYRLSAGSKLPGLAGLASYWKRDLTAALTALPGPVLDLRSGAYGNLAPLKDAITVQVLSERPDGTRQVVSHFNKATKGLVARAVAVADAVGVGDVMDLLAAAGLRTELSSPTRITVVTGLPGGRAE